MAGVVPGPNRRREGRPGRWLSAGLVSIQIALTSVAAWEYGPTVDEPAHLAAGLAVVRQGRFDLYPVNPPLVKAVAALPPASAGADPTWTYWKADAAADRFEWSIGEELLESCSRRSPALLCSARLAILPLVLLGGVACFLWGRALSGPAAGLVAQALWTFCPNVLGNGALVTPDAAAASLGVCAGYAFWRWSERPGWPRATTAGLALGLALLTKFTWLLLPPLWAALWLARRLAAGPAEARPTWLAEARQLLAALSVALLVVHAGYGFDRPLWRLGEPTFVSLALAGEGSPARGGDGGNRFRGTPLGDLPVPLPQMLVRGVDLQKLDFDEGRWSYKAGEWRFGGWRDFYLYAALVKLPLGTLALFALACFVPLRGDARRWLAVAALGFAVLILVSSETGFTRFFRYALPALPFAFVWAGRAAALASNLPGKLLVGGCLAATAASSLAVWPHSLAYFNEAAGGPANGWKHLLDANLDWGQDLPRLAQWQKGHPEATPLYLATYDQLAPEIYGLEYERAPSWPAPGWYAVGLTKLHEPDSPVKWLRKREPVARIGYSILIYRIDDERGSVGSKATVPR